MAPLREAIRKPPMICSLVARLPAGPSPAGSDAAAGIIVRLRGLLTRDRRFTPIAAALGKPRPGPGACHPLARPLNRRSAADDSRNEIRGSNGLADQHIAADADAPRNDRPFSHYRDACIQPARLTSIGRVVVGALADNGSGSDGDLLVEDGPIHDGSRTDHRVEEDDRVANARAHIHHDSGRKDGVDDRAVDHATMADQAAVNLGGGADLGRSPLLRPSVNYPLTIVQVQFRGVGQESQVGLPIGLYGPHVLPVAIEPVAEDPGAGVDHGRNDVVAEVRSIIAQPLTEGSLREDVDAHAGKIALGLARLLGPLDDATGVVHGQDPHPGGVCKRYAPHGNGHVGSVAAMGGHEWLVVHLVDVVAGEDQDRVSRRLLDDVEVLEDGVGRAAVPLGDAPPGDVRLQDPNASVVAVEVPGPAHADVVVERSGIVLSQNDDVVDVRVDAVREREIDDPILAAERDGGLRAHRREDRQPLSFAAGEYHRESSLHGASSWVLARMRRVTAMLAPDSGLRYRGGESADMWGRIRLPGDGTTPIARLYTNRRGFEKMALMRTAQWRWQPVEWPVEASWPTTWPATT